MKHIPLTAAAILASVGVSLLHPAVAYETNAVADVRAGSFPQPACTWTLDGTFHLITTGLVHQTWKTNVWVTNASPGSGWAPLLENGPSNTLHLLYKANPTNLMYTSRSAQGSWSTPVLAVQIPTSSWITINPQVTDYNYSHDMAVDEHGKVHIVWDETYGYMTGTPIDNGGYTNVSYKIFYTACADPTNPAAWPASALYDFGKRTDTVAGHDPNQHRNYRRNPMAVTATNGTIRALLYSSTAGYVGQWHEVDSTNGTAWNSTWIANGGHQSSSCELAFDKQGRRFAFYASSDLRYKFHNGTNWSGESVIPLSTTVVRGIGARQDHEGLLWIALSRAYTGAADPQAPGYHWPHTYVGSADEGFRVVETNQFSQHAYIQFGVRPCPAVDDIWPDPGHVWWTTDYASLGRVRGLSMTGLFAGKPPSGTVVLIQ